MTRIHIATDGSGRTEIECRGHAGKAEVCAGIGALVCSMAGWAHEHGGDVREERGDGYMRLSFTGCGEVARFVASALYSLAAKHPENVQLDENNFV